MLTPLQIKLILKSAAPLTPVQWKLPPENSPQLKPPGKLVSPKQLPPGKLPPTNSPPEKFSLNNCRHQTQPRVPTPNITLIQLPPQKFPIKLPHVYAQFKF